MLDGASLGMLQPAPRYTGTADGQVRKSPESGGFITLDYLTAHLESPSRLTEHNRGFVPPRSTAKEEPLEIGER